MFKKGQIVKAFGFCRTNPILVQKSVPHQFEKSGQIKITEKHDLSDGCNFLKFSNINFRTFYFKIKNNFNWHAYFKLKLKYLGEIEGSLHNLSLSYFEFCHTQLALSSFFCPKLFLQQIFIKSTTTGSYLITSYTVSNMHKIINNDSFLYNHKKRTI